MIFKSKKGFTLIELLVVVAIIGILSSIVLASLNTARKKGADASAKGSMSSMRASAELYYDTWNDYGTSGAGYGAVADIAGTTGTDIANSNSMCEYDSIVDLANGVNNQNGNAVNCQIEDAPASYTLWTLLNDGRTYCVDSTGFAGHLDNTGTFTTPAAAGGVNGVSCLP